MSPADDVPEPAAPRIRPFLERATAADDAAGAPGAGAGPGPAAPALRPFLLTAGRVRSADESIGLETQVVSTRGGFDVRETLAFERRDIVTLCAVPLSVAEISARLSLHLGVVRVLVGDLAVEGYLYIYVPTADATHDVNTILRVINGLRAIS